MDSLAPEACDRCKSKGTLYKVNCLYCEVCMFLLERKCVDVIPPLLSLETLSQISILPSHPPTVFPVSQIPQETSSGAEEHKREGLEVASPDDRKGKNVPVVPRRKEPVTFPVSQIPQETSSGAEERKREGLEVASPDDLKGKNVPVVPRKKKHVTEPSHSLSHRPSLDSQLKYRKLAPSPTLNGKVEAQNRDLLWITENVVYKRRVEIDGIKDEERVCELPDFTLNAPCSCAWLPDERLVVCGNTGTFIVTLSNGQFQNIKLREKRELPGIGVSPDSQVYFFGGKRGQKILSTVTSFDDRDRERVYQERFYQKCMREPRFWFHPAYYDNRFFIAGGGVTSQGVEVFSMKDKTFSVQMTSQRISKCALVVVKDGMLLVIQSRETLHLGLINPLMMTCTNKFQEVETAAAPVMCGNKVVVMGRDGVLYEVAIS